MDVMMKPWYLSMDWLPIYLFTLKQDDRKIFTINAGITPLAKVIS